MSGIYIFNFHQAIFHVRAANGTFNWSTCPEYSLEYYAGHSLASKLLAVLLGPLAWLEIDAMNWGRSFPPALRPKRPKCNIFVDTSFILNGLHRMSSIWDWNALSRSWDIAVAVIPMIGVLARPICCSYSRIFCVALNPSCLFLSFSHRMIYSTC